MADYYTPTVIDPMIPLAAMLPIERLFLSLVFDETVEGETAYYSSSDGANDLIGLEADVVRAALDDTSTKTSSLVAKLREEQANPGPGACDKEDIEQELTLDLLRRRRPPPRQKTPRRPAGGSLPLRPPR